MEPVVFALLAQCFHQVKKKKSVTDIWGQVLSLIPQWTESGSHEILQSRREEYLLISHQQTRVFMVILITCGPQLLKR